MIEREERSKEIVARIKKSPRLEKELSEAIYPILRKHDIDVGDDEILVFGPAVLDKPEIIFDAIDPCMWGICPPDWITVKESVIRTFSVKRLETLMKILGK